MDRDDGGRHREQAELSFHFEGGIEIVQVADSETLNREIFEKLFLHRNTGTTTHSSERTFHRTSGCTHVRWPCCHLQPKQQPQVLCEREPSARHYAGYHFNEHGVHSLKSHLFVLTDMEHIKSTPRVAWM